MWPRLRDQASGIEALCRRHRVARLDVFGSAARGVDFDAARSDIDLLVAYEGGHVPALGEFLALRDGLSAALGRPVDLAMASALQNPFLRARIEAERQPLFAA
ncbi:MAG: nucleotidyltransferase domain-containing protein [Acetobacteraceae bacterium]|nr:nucleotidyltransferase domain-containing protein [Acetobacteraceae bacterium]